MMLKTAVKCAIDSVVQLWNERTNTAKTARGTYTIASVWIEGVPRKV
jgi:hypothetical protein